MPGVAVDVGTGTSVVFATTGFTAELVSLRLVGLARRALGTSHMATPAPPGAWPSLPRQPQRPAHRLRARLGHEEPLRPR